MRHPNLPALLLTIGLLAAACGGDDGTETVDPDDPGEEVAVDDAGTADEESTDEEPTEAEPTEAEPADEAPAPDGGGSDFGTVTIGDEVVVLDDGFGCFDEVQEVAGSPGNITLQAVVSGTSAAGDAVRFDFTRFDEESMFTGDDIIVDIGDLDMETGDLSVGSYTAVLDLGAAGDPPVLSADGFTWRGDGLDDEPGAFEITC